MTTRQTPSAPQPATLPVVRLLPKANARAIRHGFPWVYANELVTDRRTKKLAPGSLAVLEDEAGRKDHARLEPASRTEVSVELHVKPEHQD